MGVLWVFYGPTAVGKTAFMLELGERFRFEVISADSRQVYRELSVGTAKPSPREMKRVPHHLVDFLPPTERYSAHRFKEDAETLIKSGRRVVVCGGTGFYIASLIYDYDFFQVPPQYDFRTEVLKKEERKPGWLFKELAATHPRWARKIGPHNVKRLMRACEIVRFSRVPVPDPPFVEKRLRSDVEVKIVLLTRRREEIYRRIEKRVDLFLNSGWVEETKRVVKKYGDSIPALESVGYPRIVNYLKGEMDYRTMREKIIVDTRRYAKRQFTFMNQFPEGKRLDLSDWKGSLKWCVEEMVKSGW